ncbi:MAG: hypothetical protein ACD_21C00250G0025 [uncultured bacterium]|nr:MAG: hypothetical protein ACD_21C00250G0025 [uncultured bacterium]
MSNTKTTDPQNRFSFGKNWSNFLNLLNEDRILEAERSIKEKLGCTTLAGMEFLDIGSGSGLFSLAAYRLGAKVFSFDYDEDSVNCTKYLKEKYAKSSDNWTIEKGSVLDQKLLKKFGKVDVVYSWGVLHHTGHMHQAFDNVANLVKDGGQLFISIYNDQGSASKKWLWVKQKYNNSSHFIRYILFICSLFRLWAPTLIKDFLKTGNPLTSWNNYGKNDRGMSAWHDVVDWVGGYPFEVAKPEEVFDFFKARGFGLRFLKTCAGGIGCNEFVFQKKK